MVFSVFHISFSNESISESLLDSTLKKAIFCFKRSKLSSSELMFYKTFVHSLSLSKRVGKSSLELRFVLCIERLMPVFSQLLLAYG
jgi:hypothetical protein